MKNPAEPVGDAKRPPMSKIDPVDAMLMQKHAALLTMRKQLTLSKSKKDRAKLRPL